MICSKPSVVRLTRSCNVVARRAHHILERRHRGIAIRADIDLEVYLPQHRQNFSAPGRRCDDLFMEAQSGFTWQ